MQLVSFILAFVLSGIFGAQWRFMGRVVYLHGQGLKCNDGRFKGLFRVDWTWPDASTSAAQLDAANASCLVD
jgi:hypothetical protein